MKIKPVTRPAGYRPPGSRPRGYRPPGYRPPRPGHLPAYGPGYWGRYPHYRYHWNRYNKNWWAYATAGAITSWWANGINRQPVYYDYGANIYYEGDQVYYQGNPVGTPEEYSQQAQTIAESAPEVDPDNVEWLPLGVFAITENEGSVENATLYLQLAISKEGLIGGTFQNTLTDDSFELEGTVDKESQRAAWGPVGKQWPIMETGLYNLTENEAGALIHFDNGQTQQWTMTRIDDQQTGKNKAAIRLDLISPPRIGWHYLDLADGRNEIRFFKARQTRNNSMKPTPILTKALCIGILMVHCSLASGQYKEEQTVNESIGVLNEIMSIPAQGIPRSMLRDAQAVAIFPGVVKASFVVGARHGNGVVMIRDDKGGWHAPVFASLTGGNIGWQVGVQSTDVVLVFKTRKSVNGLLSGRMTLGADAGIAAGPIGRQATAATDSGLGSQIYSYSRSRGLFAGVSFDGSVVRMDSIRNATYYKSSTPGAPVTIPLSAQRLGREVMQYTGAATAATFSDNLNQVPTLKASTSNQSKPILAQQYSEQEVDQLRDQLAKIAPEMYGVLDPNWQRYLGLPAQVFKANGHPSVESLIKCRTNFEYVCNDPKLVKLARYPEFQSTYGLLCHYIHELSNGKTTFDLPAPPVN